MAQIMENKTRTRRKRRRRKRINLKLLGIMLIITSVSCICMAAVKKEDEQKPLTEATEAATEEPEKVQVVFSRKNGQQPQKSTQRTGMRMKAIYWPGLQWQRRKEKAPKGRPW